MSDELTPAAAAALDAARPAELAAIIRERDEALAAWRELRLWAEENGWLEKATRSNKASEMLAALDAAPSSEPVNWKASYEQACDDADAYKADAEQRLVKLEQNWRSCQHEIAYLRDRLKIALAADGGAVSRPQENTETTKTDEARSPSIATPRRAGSTARAEGDR